jgi:uncharacterized membrane protein
LALGIVRGLLLVVLFLLFCRPQLVVDSEERTRSVVAVWVDTSMSMTLQDPYKDAGMRELARQITAKHPVPSGQTRLTRYQLGVDALANAQWLKTLTETQDVQFFRGSTHAVQVGTAHSPEQVQPLIDHLKAEKPTGESTDVPTVVQEIMHKVQGTRVSAIVLLTDGQTTESGSRLDQAINLAQRSSAKIFSLPLGQAEEPFDLALAGGMQVPESAFVRDPVAVKVRVTGAGIDRPTQVKVTLSRKEGEALTELASREYTLEPGKKALDAELIFKPNKKKDSEKAEKYDLVATVAPVGMAGTEELNSKNNQVDGVTNVLDAQINVLYVEGYPRWEFRYLKNELIREKTVNVSTLLLSADEDFAQEGDPRVVDREGKELFVGPVTRFPENMEEMGKFDVLLIGDVEPTYFSPTQQKLILEFVRKNGGGIGWIAGGNYDPESYKGTLLEPLLPITPDEIDPRARVMAPAPNEPFTLMLTAAGRESNLFRFFDDPDKNVKQLQELPEFYWYKPVQGLQPAAKVLAVHPTRTQGGTPVPLIVTGRFGNGRTMFSAVCDTWRWRRYTGEPLFQSYWLQMCRLLYQGKVLGQNKRIDLAAESNRVEVGKPIKVTMEIRDPTLSGQVPAQVPVMVMDKDGRVVETVMLQRGTGEEGHERLEGSTTATQIGDFTLKVGAGILPIDLPTYTVTVEPPQREFETIVADVESMNTLAAKTTGAVLPLYKAEELAKQVPDRSLPTLVTNSEELWYKPIALLLVVGLATAEWLLRKRAGLI